MVLVGYTVMVSVPVHGSFCLHRQTQAGTGRGHLIAIALQPVFDAIVKNAKRDHLIPECVGAGHDDRFDIGKHIETLKSAGHGVGHYLSGEMSYVDAMPGITLREKYIG